MGFMFCDLHDSLNNPSSGDINSVFHDMIAVTIQSIAENIPKPLLGIEPGSPLYKTNALTTESKSRL